MYRYNRLCNFLMLFIIVITSVISGSCFASSVVLQWDPNTEPDLAGYKVYYAIDNSGFPFVGVGVLEGPSPIDVHNWTSTTVNGLDATHTYYFAVTAYNTSGVESSFSNIVAVYETISPTVSISSPAASSIVSGTVSVVAAANDNRGISMVEFYENGSLKAAINTYPYIYSWDTNTVQNGIYALSAKAYDAAGNIGQSETITVTVNNKVSVPFTIADAMLALQAAVGKIKLSAAETAHLDVAPVINGTSMPNGKIDTADAIVILSKIVSK